VEALMFLLDSVVMVVMVYMGLRDDRRPKRAAQTSIFRMRDTPLDRETRRAPFAEPPPSAVERFSADHG
jgi:hypothetical protein